MLRGVFFFFFFLYMGISHISNKTSLLTTRFYSFRIKFNMYRERQRYMLDGINTGLCSQMVSSIISLNHGYDKNAAYLTYIVT